MKRGLVLASRILIFTITLLWVFSFMAVSFMVLPIFVDLLTNHYGLVSWGPTFLTVWFSATVLLLSVYVALVGLRFIGRWERKELPTKEQ